MRSAPTEADRLDAQVKAYSDALQRQLAQQEHARLSQELATREHEARVKILEAEFGTTEPAKVAEGFEDLVHTQEALSDPSFAIEVLGEKGLKLARGLVSIDLTSHAPDDVNYVQAVRGLKAIAVGLEGRMQQRQMVQEFFGAGNVGVSISEELSPPDREIGMALDLGQIVQAMNRAPRRAPRTAQQLRESIAAPSVSEQMRDQPVFKALEKRERAERKAEEAELRRRARA